VSFGTYALLRKRARVDALPGLMVETALLAPVAAAYIAWLAATGRSGLNQGGFGTDLLLVSAGVITVLPLLWFTEGARRLPLVTMGFLQYISPSGQFLLATLVYGEAFTAARAVMFGCIWAGLAVCSIEAAVRARRSGSGGGRSVRGPGRGGRRASRRG
jgi:chloramphenicol-sensitive protein RarD